MGDAVVRESWLALSSEALRLLTSLPMDEIERRLQMDGPAVPEGREPATVEGQPSDEELIQQAIKIGLAFQPHPHVAEVYLPFDGSENPIDNDLIAFARAVLARWGGQQPQRPIPVSERLPGPEHPPLPEAP